MDELELELFTELELELLELLEDGLELELELFDEDELEDTDDGLELEELPDDGELDEELIELDEELLEELELELFWELLDDSRNR